MHIISRVILSKNSTGRLQFCPLQIAVAVIRIFSGKPLYFSLTMVDSAGHVFIPGDVLKNLKESEKNSKVFLGPGLRQESEEIVVSKPGILRFKEPNIYWVDCHQKRVIKLCTNSFQSFELFVFT